jgi:two-component system response regulator
MNDLILLVEDNQDHAVLVQAMLDYRNISEEVFVAQNVAEAKSYLLGEYPFDDSTRHPPPGLVVMDHRLEDGTGLELLTWLREVPGFGDLPVVVFTSCRDAKVQKAAEALGVAGYFLKPYGFDAVGEAIDHIMRPNLGQDSKPEAGESGSAQAG